MKDCIIIGAGPAGLSAAIYGIRAGLDLVVVEKLSPGGQVMSTFEVENYPGFVDPIEGWDLMSRMEGQARRLGAEILSYGVTSMERDPSTGIFRLTGEDGSVMESRTVVLASGASHRKLGVPGEAEYTGRGVSYCATCDGAFYRDRVTAVVGGGDTALEEAHFLTRFAKKVYLIHRRGEFRGTKILQDRVLAHGSIEPVYHHVVDSIGGEGKVKSLVIRDVRTDRTSSLDVDGVFIFVGLDPVTGFVPRDVLNEQGEVIVDMQMATPIPGLFAAGDLRQGSIRQIITAAGDGATAVMSAYHWLRDRG